MKSAHPLPPSPGFAWRNVSCIRLFGGAVRLSSSFQLPVEICQQAVKVVVTTSLNIDGFPCVSEPVLDLRHPLLCVRVLLTNHPGLRFQLRASLRISCLLQRTLRLSHCSPQLIPLSFAAGKFGL
jgi:hypothetical protein